MSNGKGPIGPLFAFVHVPHTVPHSGAGSWHDGLANRTSMVDCGSTSAKDSAAVLRSRTLNVLRRAERVGATEPAHAC